MRSSKGLSDIVTARVTPAEKDAIRGAVADAGITLSAYCRRRVLGHAVSSATDRAMIRELRRVSGLLKKVHVDSGGAYRTETRNAIEDVRRCIEQIVTAAGSQDDRQEGR